MNKIILFFFLFIFLISCGDQKEKRYQDLISDLKSSIANKEEFPKQYLMTKDDGKLFGQIAGRNMSSEQIERTVDVKKNQQIKQFVRIQKTLIGKQKKPKYQFVSTDTIGGVIKDVHYFDLGLIYKRNEDSKIKRDLVCVFEMILLDGEYKMLDDIYILSLDRWRGHVEEKKKEILKYQ